MTNPGAASDAKEEAYDLAELVMIECTFEIARSLVAQWEPRPMPPDWHDE